MRLRFYVNPQTGEPHIYDHGVDEEEVEDVFADPWDDVNGRDGTRLAFGQTRSR